MRTVPPAPLSPSLSCSTWTESGTCTRKARRFGNSHHHNVGALRPVSPPGHSKSPVPQAFVTDGLVTYGYPGRVLLLTEISPPSQIPRAGLSFPREGFVARLSRGMHPWLGIVVTPPLRQCRPVHGRSRVAGACFCPCIAPGTDASARFSAMADARHVTLSATGIEFPCRCGVSFYSSVSGALDDSARPVVRRGAKSVSLTLDHPLRAAALSTLTGVLVVSTPGSVHGIDVNAVTIPAPAAGASGLILALLLAFVGGLILNLMPCVLPVISLKVLSFLRHSGAGGKRKPGAGARQWASLSPGAFSSPSGQLRDSSLSSARRARHSVGVSGCRIRSWLPLPRSCSSPSA